MTPARFAMALLAGAFLFAGATYGLGALMGDVASLVVGLALVGLAGWALGWLAHGFLTDAIIARCRAITEKHYQDAQRVIARAEAERDAARARADGR